MHKMIEVKNLSKSFKLFHNNKDRLLNILPFVGKVFDTHISLDKISFDVKKGEFVSIIGKNGSGKSTLLKILCSVLNQSSGEFKINGNIVSLLELGTGFIPDLSGRDNITVSAKTMNLDIEKIYLKINDIEKFAELGEYFDMPIHTYSSGMYVRLAMSLFLHLDPDIFIIDEALSVGDIFFQQKCFKKIEELRKNGVTFLFVSHDINTVLNMSDRVLLLDHSKQIYFGDKNEACKLYYDSERKIEQVRSLNNSQLKYAKVENENNVLNGKKQSKHREGAIIKSLQIVDENGKHSMQVEMTRKLIFIIEYEVDQMVLNPIAAIVIKNSKNLLITTIIQELLYEKNLLELEVPLMLEAGEYSFDLSLGNRYLNTGEVITEYTNLGPITVVFDYNNQSASFFGLVGLNTQAKFRSYH